MLIYIKFVLNKVLTINICLFYLFQLNQVNCIGDIFISLNFLKQFCFSIIPFFRSTSIWIEWKVILLSGFDIFT